jgi:uncharacterized protein YggE
MKDCTMKKADIKLLLACALCGFLAAPAQAQEDLTGGFQRPVIQVVGNGEVAARPDTAEISIGVTTEDRNVQQAVTGNNAAIDKIIGQLTRSGIDQRDIQTANFSVFPQYDQDRSGVTAPRSFRVSNTVEVTVRALSQLSRILGDVVAAGSNQINGLSFYFAQPEPILQEARKRAVEDATRKAEVLARAAGVRLGRLTLISETGTPPSQMYQTRNFAAKAARNVPVEAGESTLGAQVTMIWEIAG